MNTPCGIWVMVNSGLPLFRGKAMIMATWTFFLLSIAASSALAGVNSPPIAKRAIKASVDGPNLPAVIPGERTEGPGLGNKGAPDKRETAPTDIQQASAGDLYAEGNAFLSKEDPEKALLYFEEAVHKNPQFADAYFQIGYCNGHLGRHQKAIDAFKEVIRIKPDYADAHLNLGATYGKLGRYQEAVEAFNQAIRIDPEYAEAYGGMGWAYHKLGRPHEEIEAYKKAVHIKPDYAEAHYYLGLAYVKLGDGGSAFDEYEILKGLNRDLADQLFALIYK